MKNLLNYFIKLFPILLLLLFSNIVGAEEDIENLKKEVLLCKNDSIKVDKLIELVVFFYDSDQKVAESYATKALELSQEKNYTKGEANAKYQLCRIYSNFEYDFSETLALQSLTLAEQINDSILMARIFNVLGNLKDNMKDYETSVYYYKKALGIFQRHHQYNLIASIYNNLGISTRSEHGDGTTSGYLMKAIALNKQNNNQEWLATNYVNLGYENIMIGELDKGAEMLMMSLNICKEHHFYRILPYIYNNLSIYHSLNKDYIETVEYARLALNQSRENSNRLQEKEALINLSNSYYELNDIKNAFENLKQVNAVNDTINKYGRLKEIDLLEMRYKFEDKLKEKELESALADREHYKRENTYLFIILIAIIIIVIFFFLYSYQRNRTKQKTLEQKNTLLQKNKLSRDLDYKNKELTTNVLYLIKKNELISTISIRLKKILDDSTPELEKTINSIVIDLNQSISNDSWEEFEIRFQEVHIGFYKRLDLEFPNLSPNELRLCAFLRLNMTTKEIANITFQSPDSIKTARYRLRKKLNINRDENLISVLSKI